MKRKIIFLTLFLVLAKVSYAEDGSSANAGLVSAKIPPEHQPCIDCFNAPLFDLHKCLDLNQDKASCHDVYRKAAVWCKAQAFCKVEDLKWSPAGDRPLGGGGIFDVKRINDLADLPLETRKLMVRDGARNVPLPELSAEEIEALKKKE